MPACFPFQRDRLKSGERGRAALVDLRFALMASRSAGRISINILLIMKALILLSTAALMASRIAADDLGPKAEQQLPTRMHSQMKVLPLVKVGHSDADMVGRDIARSRQPSIILPTWAVGQWRLARGNT